MSNDGETRHYDALPVHVHANADAMGAAAAALAAERIRDALSQRSQARVILATGNSQLTMLNVLVEADLDWSRVTLFHMDEYLGIRADHPASFRRFLHDHFLHRITPAAFHGVQGEVADADAECARYTALLAEAPIDVVCMGIGENGHLAFNDPPYADFDDPVAVKVVELDRASRLQQVGEGHFPDFDSVPARAITLTIPTLLAAGTGVVTVPDARKAQAVRAALTGPLTTDCPASVLRRQANCELFLDRESASLLPEFAPS